VSFFTLPSASRAAARPATVSLPAIQFQKLPLPQLGNSYHIKPNQTGFFNIGLKTGKNFFASAAQHRFFLNLGLSRSHPHAGLS
jgi:hypothetical protein